MIIRSKYLFMNCVTVKNCVGFVYCIYTVVCKIGYYTYISHLWSKTATMSSGCCMSIGPTA